MCDMIKRYILLLLVVVVTPCMSQGLLDSFKSDNQRLVEMALKGCIIEVVQKYELSDTISGKRFGRNEKDFFNSVSFACVPTDKGLVCPLDIMVPWRNDSDFSKYIGKYKPVLKSSEFTINDSLIVVDSCTFLNYSIKKDSSYIICTDNIDEMPHFSVDSVPGKKKGWCVWISQTDKDKQKNGEKYELRCIYKELELAYGKDLLLKAPSSDNIIGGFYIVPRVETLGRLSFMFSGFMFYSDNNWKLCFPFMKDNESNSGLTIIGNE